MECLTLHSMNVQTLLLILIEKIEIWDKIQGNMNKRATQFSKEKKEIFYF